MNERLTSDHRIYPHHWIGARRVAADQPVYGIAKGPDGVDIPLMVSRGFLGPWQLTNGVLVFDGEACRLEGQLPL